MALNPQALSEENADDHGSEPNVSSTDELAGLSALARGAGELMIIQALRRYINPIFVPILRPLIRQLIKEEMESAKQEALTSGKEIPVNKATTSVLEKYKPQFRNRVHQPVFTGMPLLGENKTPLEIALVNAVTEQIVTTGTESTAILEIVGCRVGDDDDKKDSQTFEDLKKRILGEKKGKRILQGNTCVQLKEGIGFVGEISLTFNSTHTKNGWYRLGAIVVDAALMSAVEVGWTERFMVKDRRAAYSEKHPHPYLSDKVCHLQQIGYKSDRYKRLQKAGVNTVKDLLFLLHTDPEWLKNILKPKTSKTWDDIVNNAQMSNGMFLYLDSSIERNGVVLDAKLQLKGLIVESHQYLPVDQLSDKQKVEAQNLVKFAREHFGMLHPFEDETSLIEHLQSGSGFSSSQSGKQILGTSKIIDRPPRPSLQVTHSFPNLIDAPNNLNISNLHTGQSIDQAPVVTSEPERGREMPPFDDVMIYSTCYYQEHISPHALDLECPNGDYFGAAMERHAHNFTDPGTSSQAVESLLNTNGIMNRSDIYSQSPGDVVGLDCLVNYDSSIHLEISNKNSDPDVLMVAAPPVLVYEMARTRWTKVSKLLRRNSVRERMGLLEGIQTIKKQRCF